MKYVATINGKKYEVEVEKLEAYKSLDRNGVAAPATTKLSSIIFFRYSFTCSAGISSITFFAFPYPDSLYFALAIVLIFAVTALFPSQ